MTYYLKLVFLFFIISVMGVSCDNELDLVEEKKEIPVVYGLISSSDTAQYIRIERAFIDKNTSALVLAKNPDSLYYPDAVVHLIRESNNSRYRLEEVDGNEEGYPRQDGIFAQSPNTLYKLKSKDLQIAPGERYHLELVYDESRTPLTASTILLDTMDLVQPNLERPLKLQANGGFDIQIKNDPNAKVFDVFMTFHYFEQLSGSGSAPKSFTTALEKNIEEFRFDIPSDEIYSKIAQNIVFDESAIRRFRGVELTVNAAGAELLEYVNIGQANLGITSSQAIPTYTNLSTGVGVFSSRSSYVSPMITDLNGPSQDSLILGRFTRNLNFTQ